MKIAGRPLKKSKPNTYITLQGRNQIYNRASEIASRIRRKYRATVRVRRSKVSESAYIILRHEKDILCVISLRTHRVREEKEDTAYFYLNKYKRWQDLYRDIFQYLGDNFKNYQKTEEEILYHKIRKKQEKSKERGYFYKDH